MTTQRKYALVELILSASIFFFAILGAILLIKDVAFGFGIFAVVVAGCADIAVIVIGILYTVYCSKNNVRGIHLGTAIVGICSIFVYALFGLFVCSIIALNKKD